MASLIGVTSMGSYADFMQMYTSADAKFIDANGRTLLFHSVGNHNVEARIQITNRLLDDGADPSVSDNINVLHVLFTQRNHETEREAPMLRRLVDGGADINLFSKKFGPPLAVLIERGPSPESKRVPFYDVLFDQPNLELSSKYLRDLIFNSAWNLPILRERVLAYEARVK
ncbi:ankyrin repeat domain-containing protein [Mycobacteroides chelonae]|uniref:ankyrin repeat domain-containing protein n=1 Tax=Mycobacteroides chelonae TaxID=1774 RepID=UPI000991B844|nr:ankyrin repeat domain-containing protein [Mycobacteroides chelonae]